MITLRSKTPFSCSAPRAGFTLLEVMIAAGLVAMTMGSIIAMNARAMSTLRDSREAAASSQVLQQRIESIRDRAWAEVSSAAALAALMQKATDSEAELAGAGLVETMKVSVPTPGATGPTAGPQSFTVTRRDRRAQVEAAGDFAAEPTLIFEAELVWRSGPRTMTRRVRSIVCRQGLTRSGVIGSVLGRSGAEHSGL